MRALVAQLGDAPQSARAERLHVDRRLQRDELRARADVARRALAADVLLARLQREHVAGAALDVLRLADDAAGHLAHEPLAAGEQPDVRPAEPERDAQRLPFADDDVRAVRRRRPVQREADRIGGDDVERAGGVRRLAPGGRID